jgi:hypothetical protein
VRETAAGLKVPAARRGVPDGRMTRLVGISEVAGVRERMGLPAGLNER